MNNNNQNTINGGNYMKKLLAILALTIILTLSLCACNSDMSDKPRIGVCLYKYDDTYISTVRQELEKLAEELHVSPSLLESYNPYKLK